MTLGRGCVMILAVLFGFIGGGSLALTLIALISAYVVPK